MIERRAIGRALDALCRTLVVFGLAGSLLTLCAGCGSPLQSAVRTQGTLSQSLAAATSQWLAWDMERQRSVVDAAPAGGAREALAKYRATEQAPVVKAFHATWVGLVLLDGAIAAAQAGDKRDITGVINAVLNSFAELQAALARLGVALPTTTVGPTPTPREVP